MSEISKVLDGWQQARRGHEQFILTSPEGHALVHVANYAVEVLAAEVRRLRDLLSSAEHVPVVYATGAARYDAMAQYDDSEPGTILRETDTLRQWRFLGKGNGWQEI